MDDLSRFLGRFAFLRRLALLVLLLGATSSALATKTYSDNGDGTVTDPTTGLQWMRCSMGQTWTGSTCTDTAISYNWGLANALTGTVTFAGQSDWRLPNIRELLTTVDMSAYNPAIDIAAFPNTPASNFCSASTFFSASGYAWGVSFSSGNSGEADKGNPHQVRLVRAGQPIGLLDVARPSTDYVDQGNGTVSHSPTRLMWQRCAVGQTWTGSSCSGTASTFTWDAARLLTSTFAGQSDWRLPNEEELVSLVDYSRGPPTINMALFPNTAVYPSTFWSGSVDAANSGSAWWVGFDFGHARSSDKYGTYQVRLVRAGLSFGPLTLTLSKTGTGEVASNGWPFYECGALLCSGGYNSGDVVTLTASPASNLITWGEACSGTSTTCTVTMSAAQSVTANFTDHPLVSGLPASLTFTNRVVGTVSAAQNATLSNTGLAALVISNITASGDFAQTNDCGSGVAAGASCTIAVTFSPTSSGTRTGTLTITSNATSSPNSVSLSGVGLLSQTIGAISFTPSTLNMGGTTTASATATSGLVVAFSSTTPTICSVSGFTVTAVAAGICTVAADQEGNATYSAAAQVTQNITVNKVSQTIGTITFTPTTVAVGGTTTASATGGASGNAVTFSSSTSTSICTVSSIGLVTGVGVGSCAVTANQAGNGTYSAAPQVTQSITVSAAAAHLINISTRGQVQTGNNVMIGGFIIQGSTPKKVLIRAGGPSLSAYGVPGVLADPKLDLYSGQAIIATNDNWTDTPSASAIQATGLAPANSLESAILATLQPGAYTAIVRGVGETSGVGIVEVFEIDTPGNPLINISTRGLVQLGDNVMIGGFILQGDSPKTVLIRAGGPSLAAYGVPSVLADPMLELHRSSDNSIIATNDNWQTASNAAAIAATGLAPVSPLESAILITLQPGAYTAIVSGSGGGTGVGIVEVFAQ